MQKTAYEMRISDWSSDVCSSDLGGPAAAAPRLRPQERRRALPHDHRQDVLAPLANRSADGRSTWAALRSFQPTQTHAHGGRTGQLPVAGSRGSAPVADNWELAPQIGRAHV